MRRRRVEQVPSDQTALFLSLTSCFGIALLGISCGVLPVSERMKPPAPPLNSQTVAVFQWQEGTARAPPYDRTACVLLMCMYVGHYVLSVTYVWVFPAICVLVCVCMHGLLSWWFIQNLDRSLLTPCQREARAACIVFLQPY